ncbi:6-phospho-beta-glucosidase [Geomicrobium sp. JSM 1781026]|uniref:6-phospho-beta-glucosidase n=1 Tax=Geomicrobium sp. JSM 1781026 TaxID=3344580 RepID=UPI0035C25532
MKVATIGGGSSYTPELVEGLIDRYEEFPVEELWLVDIDEGQEKLNIVGNLAKRMIERAGVPIRVFLTLNREEALRGADFVTTQFRVGLLEARAKDERIPLKYEVLGQETNGPGGLFKALRTIPVILQICEQMETLCPNAWLINFTNPAGMVTEAVLRYSNIEKVVGLCNVPIGMEMNVAKRFDVDHERVRIQFAGLNHLVYGLDVFVDGVSIKEEAIRRLGESSTVKNIKGQDWEPEFIRALGVLPCSYHLYYYKSKEMVKKAMESETRAEVVQRLEEELFERYKDPDLSVKPPELEERGGAYYSDAAIRLMTSIYNDKRDIQAVNTMNRGAIHGIPYGSAVEVSCIITKDGPVPLTIGELPVAVNGLVQQIKSFERLTVEAAVTGDYEKAVLALAINPLTPSDTVAKQIVDEMLEAHRAYLPQFYSSSPKYTD